MKRIKIYNSQKEQKNEEIDLILALSYQERLQKALKMIRKVFPKHQHQSPRKINFVK